MYVFCPQPNDIQRTVTEELGNYKILTSKMQESDNFYVFS